MKLLLVPILFFLGQAAMACPACAASNMDNPEASNMVYILMTFIALTYIPFYFLYKMIYKNRNFNQVSKPQE